MRQWRAMRSWLIMGDLMRPQLVSEPEARAARGSAILRRLAPVLILTVVMISANSTSAVAGKITGLTASPNPASVQQPVTFVVQGSGTCNLVLSYADGTGLNATVPLPYQPPSHAYASLASYNASVKPAVGAGCSGQALVSVVVNAGGAGGGSSGSRQTRQQAGNAVNALQPTGETHVGSGASGVLECLLYGCSPILNQLVPLVSNITPGGGAIVEGTGFGDTIGPKSSLVLALVDWRGYMRTVPLTNLTWADDTVSGVIPGDISGVPDENAQLFVVTGTGAQSNSVDVYFVAAHDIAQLDTSQVTASCSPNGTDNYCTGSFVDVERECGALNPSAGPSYFPAVNGGHGSGFKQVSGSHSADLYSATLRNGWVFDSYDCQYQWNSDRDANETNAQPLDNTFPYGASEMQQFEVNWSVDHCDFIEYFCSVAIKGALGVPQ